MKKILLLSIMVLFTTTASAEPSFSGTWAVSKKWCESWLSRATEDMDSSQVGPSGLVTFMDDGEIEWNYSAQSCQPKKVTTNGDTFNINAICEYRGVEDIKATITGTVDGDTMKVKYPKALTETMWNLYRDYVRCE